MKIFWPFKKKEKSIEKEGSLHFEEKTKISCPYCFFELEKIPQRSSKCPSCKKQFYLEKTRKGIRLITKEEKTENENLMFFETLGLLPGAYQNRKEEFYKKMGEKANYDDFIWSFCNAVLEEKAQDKSFGEMESIYQFMGRLRADNKDELVKFQKLANRMHFMEIQKDPPFGKETMVVIVVRDDACEVCKNDSNKRFTLTQAIKDFPLPHLNCNCKSGCMCFDSIEPKTDNIAELLGE